jgi:hypothetical protein
MLPRRLKIVCFVIGIAALSATSAHAQLPMQEFTFGALGGRFPASPRVGFQVGFAYDFK